MSEVHKLVNLKELDIENTLILESSLEYLNLDNIEKISFNDKLLPYFIKNIHLLNNIDTINLNHSQYKINDPIFSTLNLNIETEDWIEEKDNIGNGCIILKNNSK